MLERMLSVCLLITLAVSAHAQKYPDKPIRVVVPFAAGTGTDILARIVTEELRTTLSVNFVIDNRGGPPDRSRPSSSRKRTRTATPCC
jgi:tripartite-type tricarboxylate transporter receptor subunit TctC